MSIFHTVTSIDAARPHDKSLIACKGCGHKWVAVYPTGTKALECPGCHNAVNKYGTRVAIRRCKTCGAEFTVCPAPPPEKLDQWQHCLSEACDSYDDSRDADKLFDAGLVERDDDGS